MSFILKLVSMASTVTVTFKGSSFLFNIFLSIYPTDMAILSSTSVQLRSESNYIKISQNDNRQTHRQTFKEQQNKVIACVIAIFSVKTISSINMFTTNN